MKLFRRRAAGASKEAALAEARRAAAKARREDEKAERYRARKQGQPVERMTTHQWLGGWN